MFCPKCGHRLQVQDAESGKGEWYCVAGEMGLSPALQQRFEERYGPHKASQSPDPPFNQHVHGGLQWFCPGDGEPLNAQLACAKCGKHLRDLVYPLVEFHPHKRGETA
jgi:hypothetical protein